MVDLVKLKTVLHQNRYNCNKLMKRVGLNRSIYRYISGARPFPLDIAVRIAYHLDVPLDTFVNENMVSLIKKTTGL